MRSLEILGFAFVSGQLHVGGADTNPAVASGAQGMLTGI